MYVKHKLKQTKSQTLCRKIQREYEIFHYTSSKNQIIKEDFKCTYLKYFFIFREIVYEFSFYIKHVTDPFILFESVKFNNERVMNYLEFFK